MNITATTTEITVNISLTEREAKMLACLIGATQPRTAEAAINKGLHFSE